MIFEACVQVNTSCITIENQIDTSNRQNFTSGSLKWSVNIDFDFDVNDIALFNRSFEVSFKDFGYQVFRFMHPGKLYLQIEEAEQITSALSSINSQVFLLEGGCVFTSGEDIYGNDEGLFGGLLYIAGGFGGGIGMVGKGGNAIKTSRWVKRLVLQSLDSAIQKKVTAINKGLVAPMFKQGVFKLTKSEAAATGFAHKIKILGKGGDVRIYGVRGANNHIFVSILMGH